MGAPRGQVEGRWREGGEGLPASPVRPLEKGPHLFTLAGWWVVPDRTDSQTLGENLLCGLGSPCSWWGSPPGEGLPPRGSVEERHLFSAQPQDGNRGGVGPLPVCFLLPKRPLVEEGRKL